MKDSQGDPRGGMSRRGFLTGTGAAAAAVAGVTAELAPARRSSTPARRASGRPPVLLQLTVNGKKITTNVEPRVTLLDALRNYLDVTGCKRVCDRGTCGACTVILNGRTVYSCTMLGVEARGTDIRPPSRSAVPGSTRCRPRSSTTTPSSAASARPASSSRCGPRSTRTRTPRPSRSRQPSPGNICRCGTYEQMRHAIVQLCKKGG